MQRLFSSFAHGWPGIGLLLQRVVTAILLLRFSIIGLTGATLSLSNLPQIVGICAGVLLLIGLWTPVAGTLIAAIELWVAITHASDPSIPVLLATFGATTAMIGPGAWSADARLFGRKRIQT